MPRMFLLLIILWRRNSMAVVCSNGQVSAID
jgi:hypothetical protein